MKKLLCFALAVAPLVAVAQNQLFYDNFTRGADPGPLSPWFTNGTTGVWTVTGGAMQSGPNNDGTYGDSYIASNYTACAVQARFKFPAGAFGGGLGVRVNTNSGAHYAAWIYPENSPGGIAGSGVLKLFKFQNWTTFGYLGNSGTPITTANVAAIGAGFHAIRVDVQTNFIAVYWDNTRLIVTNDIESTYYTNGAVSLDDWTYPGGQYVMTVDDVVVGNLGLIAGADSYSAVSGAQSSISSPGVLLNDIGGSGPLSTFLVTNVSHGVINLSSNGSFTYTATGGYTGNDSFWYRATDGTISSAPAQVALVVGADHPPVAANDSFTGPINAALSVAAPGVLANDSDVDGNALTAILVANAANGIVTLSNNGGFVYVPNAGFLGSDSFSYRASDGISNSGIATVSLSVIPLALFSDNFTRGADPGPLNDWNVASGTWTVTGGVMRGGTNATMSYGFAFITNSFGDSAAQARLRFPVGAFGGGIGSHFDVFSGAHYAAWVYPENSGGGSNVLRLIKFSNLSSFTPLAEVNLAAVGTNFHTVKLACRGTQIAVYFDGILTISTTDPAPYTSGSVSLDFWTDATGYQMSFDDVVVSGLSADDNYIVNAGSTLRIPNAGILTNDTGVFGTNLTASLSVGPAHGILTLTNNGGFAYTPTNNFVGVDSFTYQANDGTTNLGPGTVTLSVVQLNSAPVLPSQSPRTIAEFTPLTVTNTATDSDTPPQTLTYQLLSPPAGAAIDANGIVTWTPNEAQGGAAPFTITTVVTDNGVPPLSATNSFVVTVTEVNTNPVFVATPVDRTVNELALMTVTDNATDADLPAQTLTYSLLAAPAGATINSSSGQISWTPSESQGPSISNLFQVWVRDNGSPQLSATNSFYVTVSEVNTNPVFVATPASRTIAAQTPLTVTNTATDSDIPANPLSYSLLVAPSGASIDAITGVINWTPGTNQDNSTNLFTTVVTDTNTNAVNALHLTATNTFTVLVNSNPVVVLDSTALVLEGCTPTNGVVDPGESVLMMFSFKNIGTGPATNLVATLLATNGVLNPGSPQNYGVLPVGATASQAFMFAATNSSCGSSISAVLQIQDGSRNLGLASNAFTLGANGTVLAENFDSVTTPALPAGWTTTASGVQLPWFTTNSTVDTPPNAAFSTAAGNTGVNELVSPQFTLPAGPAQLSFRHLYSFELDPLRLTNAFDGGILELKIGTNAFTDVTNTGAFFITNGYTRKIDPRFGNPLSNNWCWSGTNGYITSVVSLPATAAGQSMQLRWRAGTDNGNNGGGWRVDSVVVTAFACCGHLPPVLATQTNRAVDELTLLTVNNAASGGSAPPSALTNFLVSPPAGAIISSSGVISWTPSEAQGPGTYTITTIVADNGYPSLSATNTFSVTVNEVNTAPVLPATTNYTIVELTTLTVTNTAFDSDLPANTLAYSLVNPPANATIDTNNGVITFTPDSSQAFQQYTLMTVVSDGGVPNLSATNSFTVAVTSPNTAPVLPGTSDYTINELTMLVVTNTATDADVPAQTLTYSLVTPPAHASIDTNNGVIVFSPDEAQGPGNYTITTVVTDNGTPPLSATNSFHVSVLETNSAPVLPATTNYTIAELTTLTVTNSAFDSDLPANTLTYTLLSPPAHASIDTNNGVITFTPDEAQGPGNYTITTVVTDNGTPPLSATNSFHVFVLEVNSAPVLPEVTNHTIAELAPFTVTNTATDSDLPANSLSYQLLSPPTGAVIDTNNGVITWTPSEAQGGVGSPYTITTVVTDNGSPPLSATNSFTVTVTEVNTNPVFVATPADRTVNELELMTVTNIATDADLPAQTLTYSLLVAPTGALISSAGVITWTPTETQGPSISNLFQVKVVDDGSPQLSATNSFYVTVSEVNTNPVFVATPANRTIAAQTPLTVTNNATDSDVPINPLSYSLLVAPSGASIDPNTGEINWTPSPAQDNSTNLFTTVVTDTNTNAVNALHLSATNSFTVTVTSSEGPPQLRIESIAVANEIATLTWTSISNRSYRLQFSVDLAGNSWSNVIPDIQATNGITTATNACGSAAQQFYRVLLLP